MIPMMNAKVICFVDQTIVHFQFKNQITVLVIVKILAGKVMATVMIKTTIVSVNGMEETVVVSISIQIFVHFVNV